MFLNLLKNFKSLNLFRWQPSNDPLDPRYSGEAVGSVAKFGLYSPDGEREGMGAEKDKTGDGNSQNKANEPSQPAKTVTIEELKESWGLA